MPIDGCNRTFEELAHAVLPAYMARLRERIAQPLDLSDFAEPGVGPATLCKRLELAHDPRGCYVLLDGGKPVYVGISKHVVKRLMEHVRGGDHFSATLAYRMANAAHPHGQTAAGGMRDDDFRRHFENAKTRLSCMKAAFVEIDNPLELYLFEAYCALELDTGFEAGGWNTFETH